MEMSPQEKAKIVAFARLLGKTGENKDIIKEYVVAYESAEKEFSAETPISGETVVFKSPFSR